VQVGPLKLCLFGLVLTVCIGSILLGLVRPGIATADQVKLRAVAIGGDPDTIELHVEWEWTATARRQPWRSTPREELLAVSYDTRSLVYESVHAPAGVGAYGEALAILDRQVGLDGSRQLYVIREGEDGKVTVRFRAIWPGQLDLTIPFRVHLVISAPGARVWTQEVLIASE